MPRVAVVASHPIQYQAPWFRELARVVDLEVLFCHRQDAAGQAAAGFGVPFDWDVPLLDGYPSRWLKNVARVPGTDRFSGCDTPEVGDVLGAGGFDACIVSGWYLKSYVQAVRACWRRGIKVLVRGDSHLHVPRSRVKAAAKYLPFRWFLNHFDAHLFVGDANRAYLRAYGVPEEKLFFVPHFVDNRFFADRAVKARADGSAEAMRRRFGIQRDATLFLFAGRLVEMKRADDFIQALARVRRSFSHPVHGLLVGDGPLRPSLERLAGDLAAPVHFTGFVNQSAISACYAAADALVLPSDGRETWGLVVNEAMACGVPAVVSAAAGCAPDLIADGLTGFTFPTGDVDALARRMTQIVEGDRTQMQNHVLETIERYSVGAAIDGTVAALGAVLSRVVPGRAGEVVAR